MAWDDDDWVGEPPEGRHSRERAKPEHWRVAPYAYAGLTIAIVVLVVVLLLG